MAQRRQRLPEDAPVLQERIVVRGGGAVVESGESGAPRGCLRPGRRRRPGLGQRQRGAGRNPQCFRDTWRTQDGVRGPLADRPALHRARDGRPGRWRAGDLDGDVIVIWHRFPSQYTYARQITLTATIGQPVLLTTYGRMNWVRVDDDGDGIVVWQGKGINGSVSSVRARQVTKSRTFGTEQVVASNGQFPTTAVNTVGRGIVAWERRFQVDLRIQVSVGP